MKYLDNDTPWDHRAIDNLTTAVLLFDERARLSAMNPAAEILLDISANKARGMAAGALFSGMDDLDDALSHIAKKQPFTKRETQLRLPGRHPIQMDCIVSPLGEHTHNRATQPDGILVELIPLVNRQRIARATQLLNQSEISRMLVRQLAHEIRNPLGGLRGAAQLLARELEEGALKDYTDVIIREADRLQDLMDRMLGPRTPPQKRVLNIHEVTERVRLLVQAEAPQGVSLARDYDPSIPELFGDPDLLIQAVLNIARNAVQSLGERGKVTFSTRVHRQFMIGNRHHRLVVRIDVTDNGPGIPEELKEKIFYPLVTGYEVTGDKSVSGGATGIKSGTGLGLPIAQSLVNQHGGLIECHGEPGTTTFSILLPVISDSIADGVQ
ncbi:MAG: PAS domain-containing sensor histidine kinase [Gammaproteobacteria bacterium]|nr:PAS domain-containing sensor histidine kinase [Gammaproteobacteria bacterium]NNJ84450.1 PAS domain-containing sensor histidine kinase [Gammaproteobacteria bacterium]